MKKHNLFVLTLLNISILIVITVSLLSSSLAKAKASDVVTNVKETLPTATVVPTLPSETDEPVETQVPVETTVPSEYPIPSVVSDTSEYDESGEYTIDFANTLFIGDSRAVGLKEYGGNQEINFFSDVGMSLFKKDEYSVNVKDKGKFTLNELLTNYQYDTIFIMLGLNDLGYNYESLTNKYASLVDTVAQAQPDSKIILVKNLHLTAARSDYDPTFNNNNINRLNDFIATLANNSNIYCIDSNGYYDDEYGNLNSEYSNDNTHLYAKYYTQWLQQIIDDSSYLINQN